jgi:hypothetical protein
MNRLNEKLMGIHIGTKKKKKKKELRPKEGACRKEW